MIVTPGHWCGLTFATVSGNVVANRPAAFEMATSAVGGNVTVTGTTSFPNKAGIPGLGTANVSVGGNVIFNDNHGAPNAVGGAEVKGNLTCLRNGPFTSGLVLPFMKNGVHGRVQGQCRPYSMHGDNPSITPGPPLWLRSR